MKVQTTKGLIDRELLQIKDQVTEEDNARVTATQWFLDGELVRQDVSVNMLRNPELNNQSGELNG